MVYNEKFVAVVKSKGKVLREKGDTVFVPFGAEYSIGLKNLNTVKAVVSISVDGEDALDGNELIVGPNSLIELEGFMKGRKVSNKFKFIKKTDQIAAYRGNKIGDGLIRITYKFEAPQPVVPEIKWPGPYYYHVNNNGYTSRTGNPSYPSDVFTCSQDRSAPVKSAARLGALSSMSMVSDEGITVKGSKSQQNFSVGSVGALEDIEHVIVLSLKGKLKNKVVKKAVTVKSKATCGTCGKKSKYSNSYCNNCGTALF